MQRQEILSESSPTTNPKTVIILSCDFCHRDWDGLEPMIEGHHGSLICPQCLDLAETQTSPQIIENHTQCCLCLTSLPPQTLRCWISPFDSLTLICESCITQARQVLRKSEIPRQPS